MEQAIRNQYNDRVFNELIGKFSINHAQIKPLGGFESFIMDLYIAIHRSMDMNNLDPWCAIFMNGRREKILNDVPYVDMDFIL